MGRMMSGQKAQFRDSIKEFVPKLLMGAKFSALPDIQRSRRADACLTFSKYSIQRNPGLFPDDIEELRLNIVDGAGIGALILFINLTTSLHNPIEISKSGKSRKTNQNSITSKAY